MSNVAIKVENLGKKYELGVIGAGTLYHTLWGYIDMLKGNNRANKEIFWALKNLNFNIKQGEVVGIVGKNGAGKSTLLKVLSRITEPTNGKITINGRVASLLEVGTGFHPELTGRENIFLNGAILGMRKVEIRRKFDEIVEFSGVQKFIDTPVKRYSSGMYVRLAFAVAAHLEPEVLIIDEVLSVGDAEFQRKCLGKIHEVSQKGRTVLFVSHNMDAVNSLCDRAILLEKGQIIDQGSTKNIVNKYLARAFDTNSKKEWLGSERPGDDVVKLNKVEFISTKKTNLHIVSINESVEISIHYEILKTGFNPTPHIHLFTLEGQHVLTSIPQKNIIRNQKGIFKANFLIPKNLLNCGKYSFNLSITTMSPMTAHLLDKTILNLEVIEDIYERKTDYYGKILGVVRPNLEWSILDNSKVLVSK